MVSPTFLLHIETGIRREAHAFDNRTTDPKMVVRGPLRREGRDYVPYRESQVRRPQGPEWRLPTDDRRGTKESAMTLRIVMGLIFALIVLQGDDPQDLRLLDLNVIASDNHGEPVNDLTADDFQVTDARKTQKIVFFRHKDTTLWQTPKLTPNEFSNRGDKGIPHATAILFDLMNEGFGTRGITQNQIVRALEPLETADYLYLYILTLDGQLFTVHGLPSGEETGREPQGAPWTKQIKPLLDEAIRKVFRARPFEIDVAARVQLTFAALDSLAVRLSRVPGRKNVVWLTDGVPIGLGPMRSDTGYLVDFTPQLRQLSQALERSGIAIYPVRQVMQGIPDDIGATSGGVGATGGSGSGIQSLATLDEFANTTGGRTSGGKDIGATVKQAMNDVRVSYQIGYYAPERNWDGKFHKLRVTCKRKGVRIQAKTGYYAWVDPPGAESKHAIESVISASFDAAEIGLRGTLSPDSKDRLGPHFDVRIDAKDVALGQVGDQYVGHLRLAVVSYLEDSRVESSAVVPLDIHYDAEHRDNALKEGIGFSSKIGIGEQVAKIRLIVFDRGSNAIGSLTIPVSAGAQKQQK